MTAGDARAYLYANVGVPVAPANAPAYLYANVGVADAGAHTLASYLLADVTATPTTTSQPVYLLLRVHAADPAVQAVGNAGTIPVITLGWWDGTQVQPVYVQGWWDGATVGRLRLADVVYLTSSTSTDILTDTTGTQKLEAS